MATSIQFLGTGGGRFVILSQKRYTGGLWIESNGKNFLVDPGPGALIRALQFGRDPKKLNAVLVSHNHLDHYNDAEIMLEGMTAGLQKPKGTLLMNKNVAPYVSDYHKSYVTTKLFDSPETFKLDGIEVDTIPTYDHENAFGFKFHTKQGIITYASDTNYNDALVDHYTGSDILILNVLRPTGKKIMKHLTAGEAHKLIEQSKPKKAVLNHFGQLMLQAGPARIAADIEKKTGVESIAAKDGQVIELGGKKKPQKSILNY